MQRFWTVCNGFGQCAMVALATVLNSLQRFWTVCKGCNGFGQSATVSTVLYIMKRCNVFGQSPTVPACSRVNCQDETPSILISGSSDIQKYLSCVPQQNLIKLGISIRFDSNIPCNGFATVSLKCNDHSRIFLHFKIIHE